MVENLPPRIGVRNPAGSEIRQDCKISELQENHIARRIYRANSQMPYSCVTILYCFAKLSHGSFAGVVLRVSSPDEVADPYLI